MASLFCGHYELVDADANVGNVLRDAFSNTISRVSFRTGLSEASIACVFWRAPCSLDIRREAESDPVSYVWTLDFGEGAFVVRQSNIRLNMVFKFYMPITGEIIKASTTYIKAEKALRLSLSTLPGGGFLEFTFNLFTDAGGQGMAAALYHSDSGLVGRATFERISESD